MATKSTERKSTGSPLHSSQTLCDGQRNERWVLQRIGQLRLRPSIPSPRSHGTVSQQPDAIASTTALRIAANGGKRRATKRSGKPMAAMQETCVGRLNGLGDKKGRPKPPSCRSQSCYSLQIFQITPVPGICTSGASASTRNLVSEPPLPKSRTAP